MKKKGEASAKRSKSEKEALGWQRMALTSLYFGHRDVLVPAQSFDEISSKKLVVPPVLGTLVYGEGREGGRGAMASAIKKWSNKVSSWRFTLVMPAHFNVVAADSRDWKAAFEPWNKAGPGRRGEYYPTADVKCLRDVRDFLLKIGVIFD